MDLTLDLHFRNCADIINPTAEVADFAQAASLFMNEVNQQMSKIMRLLFLDGYGITGETATVYAWPVNNCMCLEIVCENAEAFVPRYNRFYNDVEAAFDGGDVPMNFESTSERSMLMVYNDSAIKLLTALAEKKLGKSHQIFGHLSTIQHVVDRLKMYQDNSYLLPQHNI